MGPENLQMLHGHLAIRLEELEEYQAPVPCGVAAVHLHRRFLAGVTFEQPLNTGTNRRVKKFQFQNKCIIHQLKFALKQLWAHLMGGTHAWVLLARFPLSFMEERSPKHPMAWRYGTQPQHLGNRHRWFSWSAVGPKKLLTFESMQVYCHKTK